MAMEVDVGTPDASGLTSCTCTTAGYDYQRQEQYQEEENGQQVTRIRTVTETNWQPTNGRHEDTYPRELVSGSKGLPQDWLPKLGDFEFGQMQSYNPQFLAGREA